MGVEIQKQNPRPPPFFHPTLTVWEIRATKDRTKSLLRGSQRNENEFVFIPFFFYFFARFEVAGISLPLVFRDLGPKR